MKGNAYIISFAFIICVILSVILSGASYILKPQQEFNEKLDQQKNILIAANIDISKLKTNTELTTFFKSTVKPIVVSTKGMIIKNMLPDDINPKKDFDLYSLYQIKNIKTKKIISYVYPVLGKGLWSSLYGYLAVTKNGETIIGLTFYKQGETPGLGAEIEKPWFRDNFKGKSLYENGKFVGIDVVKGLAKDKTNYQKNKNHMVDGISGATITGNGVEKMLKTDPLRYQNFFKRIN